mmetsp:Transcript_5882/g.10593  ORF Transcript_5882/g.10593 Transcript_5882/m.10593 type:complete len:208 (+) Transcript_5882:283-906(+)
MARRGSSLLFALAICCYFAVSTASSFSLPRVLRIFNGSPDTAPAKDLSTDDPKAEDLRMALHTLPRGVALSGPTPARVDTLTNPSIDDIVRIGKDIWNVVEENRGVIDYATDYSGAVPRAAVSDPFTMTGWKNQDVKGWRWQLINGYNSTVSATTLYLYIYPVYGSTCPHQFRGCPLSCPSVIARFVCPPITVYPNIVQSFVCSALF